MYIKFKVDIPEGRYCNERNKTENGCRFKKFSQFGKDYCLIFEKFLESPSKAYTYNDAYLKCDKCLSRGRW